MGIMIKQISSDPEDGRILWRVVQCWSFRLQISGFSHNSLELYRIDEDDPLLLKCPHGATMAVWTYLIVREYFPYTIVSFFCEWMGGLVKVTWWWSLPIDGPQSIKSTVPSRFSMYYVLPSCVRPSPFRIEISGVPEIFVSTRRLDCYCYWNDILWIEFGIHGKMCIHHF